MAIEAAPVSASAIAVTSVDRTFIIASGNLQWQSRCRRLGSRSASIFASATSATTRVIHMFGCGTYKGYNDGDTVDLQQYNLAIDCSGLEYKAFQDLAVIMFLVYPIGVPVGAFSVFYKNRTRLMVRDNRLGLKRTDSASAHATPWWYGDRETFYFMVRLHSAA